MTRCNTEESEIGGVTKVTRYPNGASPYGVLDMSGNVFEWCLTQWAEGDIDAGGYFSRVLRGGSWDSYANDARTTPRYWDLPDEGLSLQGFRVVCSIPLVS